MRAGNTQPTKFLKAAGGTQVINFRLLKVEGFELRQGLQTLQAFNTTESQIEIVQFFEPSKAGQILYLGPTAVEFLFVVGDGLSAYFSGKGGGSSRERSGQASEEYPRFAQRARHMKNDPQPQIFGK